MVKLEFHYLRQVADACKNHMEAFLKEKQKKYQIIHVKMHITEVIDQNDTLTAFSKSN